MPAMAIMLMCLEPRSRRICSGSSARTDASSLSLLSITGPVRKVEMSLAVDDIFGVSQTSEIDVDVVWSHPL